MRSQVGPITVSSTDNPRSTTIRAPYTRWDGNQATYLFFPTFIAFVLVLLSGLSEPIINGVSVVKVDTGVNGTVSFGTWGWCVKDVPDVEDFCSGERGFSNNFSQIAPDTWPNETMVPLEAISEAVPGSYLIANGIFHIFAALATWLIVTWTLASSGYWHNKEQHAYGWTRLSFHATGASAGFILVAWALDLAMITRVGGKAINADGSQPSVAPGPSIWIMMTAFLLCLTTYAVRLFYLRHLPRPQWTIKGAGGDFHDPHQPPMSAALPHPDEHPPTWESLEINTPARAVHEKAALEDERNLKAALADANAPSVDQRGFSV